MEERERFVEALYRTYAPRLRRFCQQFVGYRSEYDDAVEECIQDVFVSAYRCYEELKVHPNVQAWLYKTCQYRMQDKIRQLRRHYARTAGEDALAVQSSPENMERGVEKSSVMETFARFLDSLNAREQTLLKKRYLHGESIREISTAMEMNENTVKVTLMRLRRRAQKYFGHSFTCSAILVTLFLFRTL